MSGNALANGYWRRAQKDLVSARRDVEGYAEAAASRAYYAAFHAVSAYFALDDRSFPKHSAVRSAMHRELVATGLLPVELGKGYDWLMELRHTGDYGAETEIPEAEAQRAVELAERLVTAIQALRPEALLSIE